MTHIILLYILLPRYSPKQCHGSSVSGGFSPKPRHLTLCFQPDQLTTTNTTPTLPHYPSHHLPSLFYTAHLKLNHDSSVSDFCPNELSPCLALLIIWPHHHQLHSCTTPPPHHLPLPFHTLHLNPSHDSLVLGFFSRPLTLAHTDCHAATTTTPTPPLCPSPSSLLLLHMVCPKPSSPNPGM